MRDRRVLPVRSNLSTATIELLTTIVGVLRIRGGPDAGGRRPSVGVIGQGHKSS
jgi:hypothetical protein